MNTLTKNRILQEGDEYRDNGAWKTVPKDNIGLQIMFTDYKEVRRPSETILPQGSATETHLAHNQENVGSTHAQAITSRNLAKRIAIQEAEAETISPDRERTPQKSAPAKAARLPAKAEKEKTPVPTPSGTGGPLYCEEHITHKQDGCEACEAEFAHSISRLPTVVSRKAHEAEWIKEHVATHPTLPAVKADPTDPTAHWGLKIRFPGVTQDHPDRPIWTGRNGTFTGYGLEATIVAENVMLTPIGKRGVGNCTIQIPVSSIPELVDWLLRQQKTPTT